MSIKKVTTNQLADQFGEMMDFFQEHVATKEDLKLLSQEFDRKLNTQKLDIIDAMDDKIRESKSYLVTGTRKEDEKVNLLVDVLAKKNVLTKKEAGAIRTLKPFLRS